MTDLRPCPFCGRNDIRMVWSRNSALIINAEPAWKVTVLCNGWPMQCGASIRILSSDLDKAKTVAAENWNRRAEEEQ